MLQTLLRIGEWQAEGKSEWDRFIEYPKVETEDKHGNPIKNYTLPIIFDLDTKQVEISEENLKEYNVFHVVESLPIIIKGRNSKAIRSSGNSSRLRRIYQSFFGKIDNDSASGELIEAIEKTNPALLSENLKNIIEKLFELKNEFKSQIINEKGEVDIKVIDDKFELGKNENIVFLTSLIKSKEFNINNPTLFTNIKGYKKFLKFTFFGDESSENRKTIESKLCYASGQTLTDVEYLNLSERYSLNKMFVTETKNYASLFNKDKFVVNYQVSTDNQEKLDYASDFLLHQGYKVKIANIDHVIIPQFLKSNKVDLEMALAVIDKKSDLLFNLKKLQKLSLDINDEIEDKIFWINFFAFESDGNFFKSTEVIKDISSFHFDKVITTFDQVNWDFKDASFTDWDSIMTEYDYDSKENFSSKLNFNSLFKVIPLRKDKEKKNKALILFKTILENRKVNLSTIYTYFTELILCHYYERYNSHTNVKQYSKDFFAFAVRDSVFKYHAFIQFLRKLNLINMEKDNTMKSQPENKYDRAIYDFFEEMALNKNQQAMFYLGRMLNSVEYIQKGKNKTVIQKVNFNGMGKDEIQRLRISLIEKAKQYNSIGKVIFTDNEFSKLFDFNNWAMNSQEAVFFLLTGYSFGIGVKDAEALSEAETE